MPPQLRLPIRTLSPLPKALAFHPVPPFILPFLHPRLLSHVQLRQQPQSRRYASVLSGLSSPSGAYSKKIRRGRGPSSGKGKTSGRGHKGQKQHGKVPKGFTGGQTKVEVAKGKRGFKNVFAAKLSPLNLDRVQAWINEGRLDTSKPITLKELSESRCLHGIKADGVKLLARDAEKLTHPINIVVSRASAAAIAAVERVGGQVVTRYYTQQSIRRILRGESHPTGPLESFPIDPPLSSVPALPTSSFPAITTPSWSISATIKSPISASAVAAPNGTGGASGLEKGRYEYALGYHYRLPNPAARKAIEYYRDPAHRGYLAHTLDNGQGPSLFFRSDAERAAEKERKMKGRGEGGKAGKKREVDNRLF